MGKEHSIQTDIEIKTYDIDMAGHVNNAVYIKWLEDLRTRLISELCSFKDLFDSGYYLVVTSTQIRYKNQLKFGDSAIGKMTLAGHSHGIMNFTASIESNGKISAAAEQKCVIMNLASGKMMPDKMINDLFNRGL